MYLELLLQLDDPTKHVGLVVQRGHQHHESHWNVANLILGLI